MKRIPKPVSKASSGTDELTRSSPIPLYYQLATRMREEILNGALQPGAQYYSDRQLIERYGVSLLTARQAMAELVTEQLLERRQGSGTFISARAGKLRSKIEQQARPDAILFTGWSPAALSGWDAMYFRDIFEGIQAEATARGLRVMFDDIHAQTARQIATEVQARGIRGALALLGTDSMQRTRVIAAAGLPVVAVNFLAESVPSILPDDFGGALLAVKHLLDLGHTRLAHLNSGESTTHWTEVKRGFGEGISAAKMSAEQNPTLLSDRLRGCTEAGYELAAKVMERKNPPTALFAGNDLMAIGAMRLLAERGLKVPDDVSVIGFDNTVAAEICSPPLTTIDVDRKEMGRAAVRLLLDTPVSPEPVKIPVRLVERSSTAKA